MSRAPRLLALLRSLQGRRAPATAEVLAEELGVSARTLYRDIATLKAEGAPVAGAAGLGYVLRRGHFLPPLAFDAEEVDAVLLGLRFAAARRDPGLAAAAARALAKIVAVLPDGTAQDAAAAPLLAGPGVASPHLPVLRRAMREERRLVLDYRDGAGRDSRRVVWPVAVGFFDAAEVLAAWCEARDAFRHFRLDRILSVTVSQERMPQRRRLLMATWRASQGLDP